LNLHPKLWDQDLLNAAANVSATPDLSKVILFNLFKLAVTIRKLVQCLIHNLDGSTYPLQMVSAPKSLSFTAHNSQIPLFHLKTSHIPDLLPDNLMASVL